MERIGNLRPCSTVGVLYLFRNVQNAQIGGGVGLLFFTIDTKAEKWYNNRVRFANPSAKTKLLYTL